MLLYYEGLKEPLNELLIILHPGLVCSQTAVSLDVKNSNKLHTSLECLIEADLLDGDNKYFCASCGKYVPP